MGIFFGNEQAEDFSSKTDEEILLLAIGKPAFFSEIVRRYEDAFLRKARAIVGDREEIFDIVQDTFTKIYLNAARFKKQDGAKFSSWAYKILMNTSFSYYQKLKKEKEKTMPLDKEVIENMSDSLGTPAVEHLDDYIVRALSKMPRHLARSLSMHFLEGYSQKEIAEEEGVTQAAVKTRVHRAKKEFKKSVLGEKPV